MLEKLLAAAGQQDGTNSADGNSLSGGSSSSGDDVSAAEVARQEGLVSGATYLLQSQAFYRCCPCRTFPGASPLTCHAALQGDHAPADSTPGRPGTSSMNQQTLACAAQIERHIHVLQYAQLEQMKWVGTENWKKGVCLRAGCTRGGRLPWRP
jgi:hypothetical protein